MAINKKLQEQIKSPKWQKRRLEILNRDEFTCQICGNKESTLHIHHLYYDNKRDYWDYKDWELITICDCCHKNEHNIKSLISDINDIKKLGITLYEIWAILETIKIGIIIGNEKSIYNIAGDSMGCWETDDIKNLTNRRIELKSRNNEKR